MRGADYWATGNEPGWTLELYRDRIVFVTDYGASCYEASVGAPASETGGAATIYSGTTDGQELVVTIRYERCTDSMSGESFEGTVEVRLGDHRYRGCGQPLH